MSDKPWQPPKVWTWEKQGGTWGSINRPVAGPTHERTLPVGKHPLQLYSMGTPNGQKVTILLEELLALGETGAEYDAHLIRIGEGDQFSSGFVEVNPNSKIPALMDHSVNPPVRVFESGAILLYLAEKFGHFLPKDHAKRTETPKPLTGCSGFRAPRPISAAVLGTSGTTRRRKSNTPLTVSPWKPSVSLTCWTASLRIIATSRVMNTPLPISRSGRGMARWD